MRRRSLTICTARSASCRSSAIFLPGSPPSPDCCEAGDDCAGSGAVHKPAMHAAGALSSFYYRPRPESAEELELLKRLDRIFTDCPVYGSRRLQVALLREGISMARRRVRRLMRKLGLWAVRPKRNTSKRHPGHKVY